MSEAAGRWRPLLLTSLVIAMLLWGGWTWWEVRRYRRAMAEIEEEIENGRHGTAARKLVSLLARQPDSDEAHYLLGACEMARGQTQAADAAWARVSPGSRFAPRAIFGSMQLQMGRGQFAQAEQIIRNGLNDPRVDRASLPILLGLVYGPEGRLEETLQVIEDRWHALNEAGEGATEPALNLVRAHVDVRSDLLPIDMIRAALDQAGRSAPDDDRIWLGKANLAIRAGSYDEAARWLDACATRRSDDVPVWSARLDWAVKTDRVAKAHEALMHLPRKVLTPARIHKLDAWFRARRGDVELERRALERLIAADPADFIAIDRLAELAMRIGRPNRAAELSNWKIEIERIASRYRRLQARHQPRRDSAEMGILAVQLGQRFEGKGFLTAAVAIDPERNDVRRALARLNQDADTVEISGRTLADALAQELGDERARRVPGKIRADD